MKAIAVAFVAHASLCGTYGGDTKLCLEQDSLATYGTRAECLKRGQALLDQGRRAFAYVRIPKPHESKLKCLEKAKPPASAPAAKQPSWWW